MSVDPLVEGGGVARAQQPATDDRLRAVLEWERAMLGAASLHEFLAAARAPAPGAEAATVTLCLCDPGHELRHLLLGDGRTPAPPGLLFTDSLVGLAPQLALLHEAWLGAYRAADHALIFPGASGLRKVALFPLRSRGSTIGSLNLGSTQEADGLQHSEPWLLSHACEVMSVVLERHLDRMRLRRSGLSHPLTGWHTKRYLQARLHEAVSRCQRHGGHVTCVLVDVDRLQAVNDAYGQLAGDHALREIASRIEGQLRASDVAAHVGADEFVVLLSDTSVDLAVPLANRILAAVRAEPVPIGTAQALHMSVSIGLATLPALPTQSGADRKSVSDHLLARAESALYLAKSEGGDRYSIESIEAA